MKTNSEIKCWGDASNGRLGYEDTETLGDSLNDNLRNVVELGLDYEFESVSCDDVFSFMKIQRWKYSNWIQARRGACWK